MTTPPETLEKVRAMPMASRLEFLQNLERLIELHNKQNDLMRQLHIAMMKPWMDQLLEENKVESFTEYWEAKRIHRLLNAIERSKFEGTTTVVFEQYRWPLEWAEYISGEVKRQLEARGLLEPWRWHSVKQYWKRKAMARDDNGIVP